MCKHSSYIWNDLNGDFIKLHPCNAHRRSARKKQGVKPRAHEHTPDWAEGRLQEELSVDTLKLISLGHRARKFRAIITQPKSKGGKKILITSCQSKHLNTAVGSNLNIILCVSRVKWKSDVHRQPRSNNWPFQYIHSGKQINMYLWKNQAVVIFCRTISPCPRDFWNHMLHVPGEFDMTAADGMFHEIESKYNRCEWCLCQ